MELIFATRRLQRVCTEQRRMQAELGAVMAKSLRLRIAELTYVETMADLLDGPGHWEELTADRAGMWSARLTGNWRLIVRPHDGRPVVVEIVEIVDYH